MREILDHVFMVTMSMVLGFIPMFVGCGSPCENSRDDLDAVTQEKLRTGEWIQRDEYIGPPPTLKPGQKVLHLLTEQEGIITEIWWRTHCYDTYRWNGYRVKFHDGKAFFIEECRQFEVEPIEKLEPDDG